MEATIDSGGRLLLPKSLREALGLAPGSKVDISAYGNGLQITRVAAPRASSAIPKAGSSPAGIQPSRTTCCSP